MGGREEGGGREGRQEREEGEGGEDDIVNANTCTWW